MLARPMSSPAPSLTSAAPPDALPVPAQAILLLALAAFASGVSLRITDPLLPRLAMEFGVSLGGASSVVTAFSIAYGFSQLLFGPLGDRYGKYVVVAWACTASALTSLACGLAPNFESLIVARLLSGATAAAVIPLSMAWIGDVVPYAIRQPVIARFLVGQIMGLSTGVLVGGLAADHLGRHWPFIGIAAIFLGIGIALLSLDKRLPAQAKLTSRVAGHVVQRTVAEFGAVLVKPWARVVLLTVFLEGGFLYGCFAFIAAHLHVQFAISLASAGLLVMLFGMGGLLFAGASKWMVKRLGEAGMALWGGVLMAMSLALVAFGPTWWWSIPGCFIAGLGFYMLHNTLQTNATQMAPERRGAAVATFASLFYMGQTAGVWAAGMLIGIAGSRVVIGLGALGVLVVGFGFSRLRTHSPHAHRGT
jgi:predicted MFS family arabinose efflux permease